MPGKTGIKARLAAVKWRGLVLNVLLFAALVTGIRVWQQRDMAEGQAPALHGLDLAGQPYVLPAHPGKPMLVHFWGTWCAVCRSEQASIDALAHGKAEVVTVALKSGAPSEVARFMREQGIDFPVVNDPDGALAKEWGVHGVPASFILDAQGRIRFVEVGYTTETGLRLRLWLARMLS
jgi:peroxiredoxin